MTTRERWIVYPLLLLVISMSLKDKLKPQEKNLELEKLSVEQLKAGQIITPSIRGGVANFREMAAPLIQGRRIQTVDPQGNPKVVLHMTPTVDNEKPDFEKAQGAITLVSGENQEMLAIGGGLGGGFIAVRSTENPQDFVAFGYQGGRTGMFWLDKEGKPQGFLKPLNLASPKNGPPDTEDEDAEKNAP